MQASLEGHDVEKCLVPRPSKVSKMLKEIVFSAAIILGLILNIIYVEHPDATSYTIAFVFSLAVLSPFALWWKLRVMKNPMGLTKEPDDESSIPMDSISANQRQTPNSGEP